MAANVAANTVTITHRDSSSSDQGASTSTVQLLSTPHSGHQPQQDQDTAASSRARALPMNRPAPLPALSDARPGTGSRRRVYQPQQTGEQHRARYAALLERVKEERSAPPPRVAAAAVSPTSGTGGNDAHRPSASAPSTSTQHHSERSLLSNAGGQCSTSTSTRVKGRGLEHKLITGEPGSGGHRTSPKSKRFEGGPELMLAPLDPRDGKFPTQEAAQSSSELHSNHAEPSHAQPMSSPSSAGQLASHIAPQCSPKTSVWLLERYAGARSKGDMVEAQSVLELMKQNPRGALVPAAVLEQLQPGASSASCDAAG